MLLIEKAAALLVDVGYLGIIDAIETAIAEVPSFISCLLSS